MQRLTSEELKREQQKTLASPRMRYGLLARPLFVSMDLLYGRRKTLSKFKVLEIVARVPYQAWENVAYVAMTHTHADPNFARRIFDRIKEVRIQQDNEQWHLLILGEVTGKKGIRENFFLYWLIPQVLAFVYYNISWFLYVIRPRWSYLLNVHFEDHAEHEYMEFVAENPALESEPFESVFAEDYGQFASLADLFRQIGYDERVHKLESLDRVESARFQ
ncbi:MAG: alternative oxidase [Candidatus Methylomirabilia bacterium]